MRSSKIPASFDGSQPSSGVGVITTGASLIFPNLSNPFIFGSGVTLQGTANQQQMCEFVSPWTITIGHVAFVVGTPLAASLLGIAFYSGDLTTKLAFADAMSTAVAGAVRAALNVQLQLVQGTKYFLGWTGTDSTTVTLDNILQDANVPTGFNAQGVMRQGRSASATAGGVTLAAPVSFPTNIQLRLPIFYFDL